MPAFTRAKYESSGGYIHPIRIQPATLAAAGPIPVPAVTSNISVNILKGKREYGLGPRGVRIAKSFGIAPDTFSRYAFIPVLTIAAYNTTPFVMNGTVQYKGTPWTVVAMIPESIK